MTETWRPLLRGEMAQRAWQAIRAIAAHIETAPVGRQEPAGLTPREWNLSSGAAGNALFFAYLATATGDEHMAERACAQLEDALEGAARQPTVPGLWDGVMGVAWCFDHLEGTLFESEGEPEDAADVADADELLVHYLGAPRPAGHGEPACSYDLVEGLAGFGVACLEGLPRPGARAGLDLVLDRLLAGAERERGGVRWLTPPRLLPGWQRELAPEGYYNLGVAHGMPAVLTLLARCLARGIRAGELRPVLDGLVEWLLAQRAAAGFPSWVAVGEARHMASRLAWCYGDLGIAGALLAAGRAAGHEPWQREALDIACRAAARDPELSGIKDAGICHGAAGVGHIMNRLWQSTGAEALAESARHWLNETLAMRRPGRGVGGYEAWTVCRDHAGDGGLDWVAEPGLLTGAAGVGLCLLAAVSDREPAWDRALALSAPEPDLAAKTVEAAEAAEAA